MTTKKFHLGDILSIVAGKLVSLQNVDGVFEILNFMTGDGLHMHQLSRVAEECKPYLLEQFPQLKDIDASEVNGDNWRQWLDEQVKRYGEEFEVQPLPEGVHKFINPVLELIEMRKEKTMTDKNETIKKWIEKAESLLPQRTEDDIRKKFKEEFGLDAEKTYHFENVVTVWGATLEIDIPEDVNEKYGRIVFSVESEKDQEIQHDWGYQIYSDYVLISKRKGGYYYQVWLYKREE